MSQIPEVLSTHSISLESGSPAPLRLFCWRPHYFFLKKKKLPESSFLLNYFVLKVSSRVYINVFQKPSCAKQTVRQHVSTPFLAASFPMLQETHGVSSNYCRGIWINYKQAQTTFLNKQFLGLSPYKINIRSNALDITNNAARVTSLEC